MLEPYLIKSLRINLLDNARKALIPSSTGCPGSPGDGSSPGRSSSPNYSNTPNTPNNPSRIHIETKVFRGNCTIRVTDNGKGIPADALRHLTEAFFRVDKSRARSLGGVGLGLTLCSKIVKLHGGKMRFESREGSGTVVSITLRGRQNV
jgi:signal transduction histidine kinase